jgi:hypothetical protein
MVCRLSRPARCISLFDIVDVFVVIEET